MPIGDTIIPSKQSSPIRTHSYLLYEGFYYAMTPLCETNNTLVLKHSRYKPINYCLGNSCDSLHFSRGCRNMLQLGWPRLPYDPGYWITKLYCFCTISLIAIWICNLNAVTLSDILMRQTTLYWLDRVRIASIGNGSTSCLNQLNHYSRGANENKPNWNS